MNLPLPFEQDMCQILGNGYTAFREALLSEPTVSIRLNKSKPVSNPNYEPVPWATDGYYLPHRPQFTFDPLFHAGCYYVQEASSMFVEQAVRQHLGKARVALDLCAAPGGKSTLLRSLLPDNCVLVSNEVVHNRAQVLTENITKWGHPYCIVTSNAPTDFTSLGAVFDLILVDAPCSGEGMFRKDKTAIAEWSPENVVQCQQRQRGILTEIWDTLQPGGLLIYSTCTFNIKENEENVHWMMEHLGAECLPIAIDPAWDITPSLLSNVPYAYRFLPNHTRGEGFFLSAVRKPRESSSVLHGIRERNHKNTKKGKVSNDPIPSECKSWLTENDNYTFRITGNKVVATPTDMETLYIQLSNRLHILKSGVAFAEIKGRDIIPTHALSMSSSLHTNAFIRYELNYTDALRYLHCETVILPPDIPRGFILVTYRDIPLGFVKNLGNRTNNLYPNEWRIRSSHFPESDTTVL